MSRSRRSKKAVKMEFLKLLQMELEKAVKIELERRQNELPDAVSAESGVALNRSRTRKTKYKPEFCEMMLRSAEEGKILTEFAAKIEVSISAIEAWAKRYPEFKEAIEIAKSKHESFWWELARKYMKEKWSYELFLFVMVNFHGYRNPDLQINYYARPEVNGGVAILPDFKQMDQILKEEEEERRARDESGQDNSSSGDGDLGSAGDADKKRGAGGDLEAAEDPEETT